MTDFSLHVNRVVVQTTLRDETCGITPPAGLRFSDTTLPVEKMRFALSVIERIRRPSPVPEEVSEEVSEEDLAREIVFLQSESLFNATKAIVRKLTLAPIAYMLRKEGEEYHIPYEIFAFGAMLVSNVQLKFANPAYILLRFSASFVYSLIYLKISI